MNRFAFHFIVLVLIGMGWSITFPLTKIAVSTGHQHFGLLLWQLALGFAALTCVGLVRRKALPVHRGAIRTYVIIALVGAVVPNSLSYQAAVHLPSGVLSILISMVPIWAFPIALLLANDRFEWRRLSGLLLGFLAVLLLVLPTADIKGALPVLWLLATVFVALCYGFEGNYVARWGTAGCDPIETLWGATLVGLLLTGPLVYFTGQWIPVAEPFGQPEWAQVTLSLLSIMAYCGYVWLVTRAGPVFAVQVSYLVTIFGVFWAFVILGERYPSSVWASLILMLAGMALVQPRRRPVEDDRAIAETGTN